MPPPACTDRKTTQLHNIPVAGPSLWWAEAQKMLLWCETLERHVWPLMKLGNCRQQTLPTVKIKLLKDYAKWKTKKTSLSCHRRTRMTCYVTPIVHNVLYTKLDARYDKVTEVIALTESRSITCATTINRLAMATLQLHCSSDFTTKF